MPSPKSLSLSRRAFLRRTACAGLGVSGLFSAMSNLRLINATLSAQGLPPGDDYKSLVCLFFYGGNDANNVLVPYDTENYNAYATARGILGLSRESLLPITPIVAPGDGREYAFHPSLARLRDLFDNGRAAVVTNVGTLVAPITKADYQSGGAAVPPYLFSHNDQQVQWQTSVPDSPKKIGWGGRMADVMAEYNAASNLSMNISIAGNNFFQVGNEAFQYHVTPGGSLGLSQYDVTWSPVREQYQALASLLAHDHDHLFEAEYGRIMQRGIDNDTLLKNTLAAVPEYTEYFPPHPADGEVSRLQGQLRMILRLIAAREELGMRRQIFFCSMGGFDTHDAQLDDHTALLAEFSEAVADFEVATEALGFANDVTLFTASDFNRTYSSNGKGSDHAWGSHQFAIGGAVQGGRLYGQMPVTILGGPDDTNSRGAWIPTTSVDEYSATLARWFGVSDSEMSTVLPNIGRFANSNLGFMA